MSELPIESVLPGLKAVLRSGTSTVLVAEPGAGKTTRVPLALLDEPWLAGRRIVMLEPRRLAARAAARFMAAALGEQAGETVGYRVKGDTRVGPKTKIEVVTEGVLTRLLQADPSLEDVGIVIFDEFHERSLHGDLGLALCLQSRAVFRDDLRILVMSATLEAGPIAELLGGAPVLASVGRMYPVETRYLPRPFEDSAESAAVRAVLDALNREQGDILVFLPGAGEIRRVDSKLKELVQDQRALVVPLYGNLPQEAQDKAISPGSGGRRKVVLATSIAETSITVEGVRVVIDSGLMRVPRFSPRTGMARLETVPVSKASADQRRGRAGRLAPGVCYRMWTEQEDRQLLPQSSPEILESDLAPLALELAVWGTEDPADLQWLDAPPAGAYRQARELLTGLGALGPKGTITPHGQRMAELAFHPRLAHMILKALPLGLGGTACELAALLSERDIFRGEQTAFQADLRLRLDALHQVGEGKGRGEPVHISGFTVDSAACRRIAAEASRSKQGLGIALKERAGQSSIAPAGEENAEQNSSEACGLLLAFAYPDRIGSQRGNGRFLLSSGRGAVLAGVQPLGKEPYLVAAELEDQGAESRVFLAAPITMQDLERHFTDQIEEETEVAWDRSAQAVRARKRVRLGALILKEAPLSQPDPDQVLKALLSGIVEEGLDILPWTRAARQLQQRLVFMHSLEADWPDVSEDALAASLEDWLAPHLYGMKSRSDLQQLPLAEAILSMLPWNRRQELDEAAPTHTTVPSGSRIPVDYSDPVAPVLAVRLQEMFGLADTPRIGRGRVPLTLHLLSPAQRPVQVTRDLASFWQNAYFDVKKDLKGRYPKHYWPDDPLQAAPTNRTRPRV